MCNSWNFQWRCTNETFWYIFKMWNYQSFMQCRLWPYMVELIESAVLAFKESPWKWQCVFYCLLVICNSKVPKFIHEKVFLLTASLRCKTLLNLKKSGKMLCFLHSHYQFYSFCKVNIVSSYPDATLKPQIRSHKKFAIIMRIEDPLFGVPLTKGTNQTGTNCISQHWQKAEYKVILSQ